MTEHRTRYIARRPMIAVALAAAAVAVTFGCLALASRPAGAASLGTLNSQLSSTRTRAAGLSASLSSLQGEIGTLNGQIALVQSREDAVRATLAADTTRLDGVRAAVARERARVALMRRLLARARSILAAQLVSRYESTPPSLVSVVVDAHGFSQLLEQLQYLGDAEHQQQTAIQLATAAKLAATIETVRLGRLVRSDARVTHAAALQANALAGMNALLGSRESALADVRTAQQTALAAVQARGASLTNAITRVRAEQAAAARAAQLRAEQLRAQQLQAEQLQAQQQQQQSQPSGAPAPSGAASLVPSGGWAIPYPIVLCESGGQNLPPNSAGASGYYQIIPSTWSQFGGTGPAAYLASKAEQDAVASRIWNGGAGASDWACSAIVSQG